MAHIKTWPDADTERSMLKTVGLVELYYGGDSYPLDLCCHVKALLSRVRELEGILNADPVMLFADGREPTNNERHLMNLLSWRRDEAHKAQREVEWLKRYERAMQSMAAQICSPATTAEEMVADILGEPRPEKRRATR